MKQKIDKSLVYPGPKAMPPAISKFLLSDIENWRGTGVSIFEYSLRTPIYEKFHKETFSKLNNLLKVPKDWRIIWMQGPPRMHYTTIAMNIMNPDARIAVVNTGETSIQMITELSSVFSNITDIQIGKH